MQVKLLKLKQSDRNPVVINKRCIFLQFICCFAATEDKTTIWDETTAFAIGFSEQQSK